MVTTSATPNRIAPYLSEPQKLVIPATREGREGLLTDAVFAAVAALQGLLTHADPKVVMRAAEMILSLETTRQRHGRVLIGMEMPMLEDHPSTESGLGVDRRPAVGGPPQRAAPPIGGDVETTRCGGPAGRPRRTDVSNPLDGFVEKVRAELQRQEDAEGSGVVVSREQAEECARYIQSNAHRTPPFDPIPTGIPGNRNEPERRAKPWIR